MPTMNLEVKWNGVGIVTITSFFGYKICLFIISEWVPVSVCIG